jgi:hypothetical protein
MQDLFGFFSSHREPKDLDDEEGEGSGKGGNQDQILTRHGVITPFACSTDCSSD